MAETRQRNMVQRLDGRIVNAGSVRGMISICITGCCCGHTDRGFAPVDGDFWHHEWERRKFRNKVHLNQGGCLGPCVLANVVMVLLDGRPYWFHSVNDNATVVAIYDFIEALLEDAAAPPPALLQPLLFNGFAWDGSAVTPAGVQPEAAKFPESHGDGILMLTQADTDLLTLGRARSLLPQGFAPVLAAHVGRLPDDEAVDALLNRLLPQAQIVIARLHANGTFMHGLERLRVWAEETGGFLLCMPAVEAFDPDLMARSNVGVQLAQAISVYFQCGGAQNFANALLCASDHLLVTGWGFDPAEELPLHGHYTPMRSAFDVDAAWDAVDTASAHPGASVSAGEAVPLQELASAADAVQQTRSAAPLGVVGLLFYRAHLFSGNTEFVDQMIEAFEARGLAVRAVYTQSLKESDADGVPFALKLLEEGGAPDLIVSTLSFALGDAEGILSRIDTPIVQAIASSSDHASWQRNGRGLNPLDTAINVAIPEFDGRIISVPVAFKEQQEDGSSRNVGDPERIARLAGIIERMVTLRHKPNAEKRIAVVFTNSAAKAARIGNAVGLDAPESLVRLIAEMRKQGYTIEGAPQEADTLLHNLIDRCSYDQIWLTDAQLAQAEKLPVSSYMGWFASIPANSQQAITRQWGPPPGPAYVKDGAFALAGLEYGNLFVALQPPRGYEMDPNEIYHRPDMAPPHNYYALYRWLRDEWRADAIVHMGKHGTLEWLPGKSVGLSGECFPDLFLGDLPMIYPFIINDPGEGAQAKRRSHATIIDHMTPPMTSAGAYGALAELAQLVDEYYTAEQLDPAKLPLLQRQIWDVIQRNRLDDDLKYLLNEDHGDHSHEWDGAFLDDGTPTAFAELQGAQVAHLLEDIEGYICELTGAQIRDGLHILGYMPQDEQLVELLYHLLKLPNVAAPSLPMTLGRALGVDWMRLNDKPGQRLDEQLATRLGLHFPNLFTHADLIQQIESVTRAWIRAVADGAWDATLAEPIVATWLDQYLQQEPGALGESEAQEITRDAAAALAYAATFIVPRLKQGAVDEVKNLLHALDGGYIPAGPSGAPTRGMAHVLPTGRNFYSLDPRALPSVASWQVGQGLADTLIQRYQREEGAFPNSVGISIWGTSAMRTAGDDIAQVLALLGVRPRWQQENRRVVGIELIPLEELGRPRVDVVCRISGFFRDAFPHLIALIDQAVQMVIDADEPLDMNAPRRHALENEAAQRVQGIEESLAHERARYRIFGCRPGSYGAGILPLIDAKNWQSDADFARAYLLWGGYAFTGEANSVHAEDEFARALATVQVATKNQDNREHDIFDSDDYLQYHGGMIATVRALTGKNPRRYFGDSSNPSRVQTRDLREEARRVFRSRVVNPKWLESMRRHGYKGALEIAATVDYLFGYDATAQVLEDWMYEKVTEEFLRNEEMQQFFSESNPWAWHAIAERLLEAVEREMWEDPNPEDVSLLEMARSVGLQDILLRRQSE